MDEFSDAIKHLEANQQASCGCEKLNALFGEEKKMQKGAVENMQQQVRGISSISNFANFSRCIFVFVAFSLVRFSGMYQPLILPFL